VPEYTASQRAALTRSQELEHRIGAQPHAFRVLTGDRPTGPLHLGHYFGSLLNRVRLQDNGVDLMVLIADYQVLTDRDAGADLAGIVRALVADYLAVGIDPSRSTIFCHSAVPQLNELVLPFLSLVSAAELQRNPTVKAETELTGRGPSGLMLTYPVHQAADILFSRANLVPVGIDQLPHIEMTRLIARRFNERYEPLFPEPEALLSLSPALLGLDGQKMSKSRGNSIALSASDDVTAEVIRRTPTDSERLVTYEPDRRPQLATLIELLAITTEQDPHAVAERVGAGGAGRLKAELIEAVNEVLRPIRERRRLAAADPGELDRILDKGNARAREIATDTLDRVHEALGMSHANRGQAKQTVIAMN
jgi:tryptophanyl-tRNA synthetase